MLEAVDQAEADKRLAELILYVAEQTRDDKSAGATKLNKYLYFADFAAMRLLGRPITGAEYQKLEHGPAPRRLLPVRQRLIESGAAALEKRPDAFGYVRKELVPLRSARMDLFSPEEVQVIDEVVGALRKMTAAEVSALSHAEAGWQLVDEGQTIPFELAYVVPPDKVVVTPAMRSRAEEILGEYADRLV